MLPAYPSSTFSFPEQGRWAQEGRAERRHPPEFDPESPRYSPGLRLSGSDYLHVPAAYDPNPIRETADCSNAKGPKPGQLTPVIRNADLQVRMMMMMMMMMTTILKVIP